MEDKPSSSVAGDSAIVLSQALRLLYLLVAAGVFLLDRLTKAVVENTLALHDSRTVIPGFFNLVSIRNQGIAFGILADSPSAVKTFLLIVLSSIALAGVAFLLWNGASASDKLNAGLALILGGALGNLFDRVQHGSVVDFLDFSIAGYHWPAFNFADSAIVAGGFLLLLHMVHDR